MGDGFATYIDRLELMAFFSGFPIVYCMVHLIVDAKDVQQPGKSRLLSLLPMTYAVIATLYLGLLLSNLLPDFSFYNLSFEYPYAYLKLFGLIALLFWIPELRKKSVLSLLHSMVFFFILCNDILISIFSSSTIDVIRNEMKIYGLSIVFNSAALAIVFLVDKGLVQITNRGLYFIHKKNNNQSFSSIS